MPVLRVKSREGNIWGKIADSILNPLTSKHRIIMRKLLNMPEYIQQKKSKGSLIQAITSLRNINSVRKFGSRPNIPLPKEMNDIKHNQNIRPLKSKTRRYSRESASFCL